MMRIFSVCVSLVFAVGCSSGEDQVFVGQEYSYLVPGQFVRANPPDPVPEGNSLRIPVEFVDQEQIRELSVSVLVFDDRDYSSEFIVGRLASPEQASQHTPAGIDDRGYFVLELETDRGVNNRYSTIDDTGTATPAFMGLHYAAIRSVPDEDDGAVVGPRPVCQIHFALDGLAVQAHVSGEACAPEHFDWLVSDMQASFENWRIPG